jgi:hypothetical protein
MPIKKPYSNANIPKWILTASNDRLIGHIKYLTHNKQTNDRALNRARARYTKAEKQLREILIKGDNMENKLLRYRMDFLFKSGTALNVSLDTTKDGIGIMKAMVYDNLNGDKKETMHIEVNEGVYYLDLESVEAFFCTNGEVIE